MKRGTKYTGVYNTVENNAEYHNLDYPNTKSYCDDSDVNIDRTIGYDCWSDEKYAIGINPDKCGPGQEHRAGRCYDPNYSWGCGTLIARCHDGSLGCKGDCYKSYVIDRGVAECQDDRYKKAGMCYKKCPKGYYGFGAGDRCIPNKDWNGNLCIGGCITKQRTTCPDGMKYDRSWDVDKECKPDTDQYCINKYGVGWKLYKDGNKRTCVKCSGTPNCGYVTRKTGEQCYPGNDLHNPYCEDIMETSVSCTCTT
jgi:hypothetical protein